MTSYDSRQLAVNYALGSLQKEDNIDTKKLIDRAAAIDSFMCENEQFE